MRSLTIQIPHPCHEQWGEMQPVDRGRFCGSCQKTVVDYTGFSDQELIRLLSQRSSGMACGRFLDEQLNRPLAEPKSGTSVWRHWLGLLTMGMVSWQTVRGQSVPMTTTAPPASVRPVFSVSAIPLQKAIDSTATVAISGRVMLEDSNGHVAPMVGWHVSVSQSGEMWEARTDSNGLFSVAVPVRVQEGPIQKPVNYTINASFPGYRRAGAAVSVKPTATSVLSDDIILRQLMPRKDITGGGICIVQPPSRWQKLKRKLFH